MRKLRYWRKNYFAKIYDCVEIPNCSISYECKHTKHNTNCSFVCSVCVKSKHIFARFLFQIYFKTQRDWKFCNCTPFPYYIHYIYLLLFSRHPVSMNFILTIMHIQQNILNSTQNNFIYGNCLLVQTGKVANVWFQNFNYILL